MALLGFGLINCREPRKTALRQAQRERHTI